MTTYEHLTYEQFLDRVIADGIAEVRMTYADPKDHHKRDGAIEGFEACRGKTPDELLKIWPRLEGSADEFVLANQADPMEDDDKTYWRLRYKALQVEFVLNVLSAARLNAGHAALLPHHPTAHGFITYAKIVGVRA